MRGLSFETLPKIRTNNASLVVTGNIHLSSKGNTDKNTVVEDVEYDADELPD